MPAIITVNLSTDGRLFLLKTPYDAGWRDEFKIKIPPRDRTWDGERKVWGVSREYYAIACEVTRKYFGDNADFRLSPAAEAALTDIMVDELAEPALEDYVILGLRPEATPLVIHAAYDAAELFVTVKAYVSQHGADMEDAFFRKLPAWMRGRPKVDYVNPDDFKILATDADMGPAAPIETIRDAYQRICKHKDIDPIMPTATFEQLAGDDEDAEADPVAHARRVKMLSEAIMDSMAAKKTK